MGEEEKKPAEEKKPEEAKAAAAAEGEKKEAAAKAEKPAEDGKKEEKKSEEPKGEQQESPPPPPPPQEIVLRVFMHCEGCARKVRRCLKGFPGVEDVITDCRASKVVVKGEKADPVKPPVITVVLGVYMHCEACAQEIKRRIQRMKGVESAEPDLKSSQVTVKGVFEPEKLAEYVYKRTGKHAAIIKVEPEKKEEKGKEEEKKADEGEKEAAKKGEEEPKKTGRRRRCRRRRATGKSGGRGGGPEAGGEKERVLLLLPAELPVVPSKVHPRDECLSSPDLQRREPQCM
ncbi:Heavy metal-associated isoprenylated plant protein 7 [Sesamum angolense]|uniref:Heavy metal-associated isoprenylated plant protein 7 n=1 Tax=Sesamum angolense TaxID=2727404 RepID=A0AAE1WLE4_9LAMI|nr:Heavy metal-associated isoprenylated plant protein 7 [Sesamum angolense]